MDVTTELQWLIYISVPLLIMVIAYFAKKADDRAEKRLNDHDEAFLRIEKEIQEKVSSLEKKLDYKISETVKGQQQILAAIGGIREMLAGDKQKLTNLEMFVNKHSINIDSKLENYGIKISQHDRAIDVLNVKTKALERNVGWTKES